MSNPEELIDFQVKINLTPKEKVSCQYDYSRGYTCIVDNLETHQSRFFNIDFITGEYTFTPLQDDAISSREISKMLIHHESCLPDQPDLSEFTKNKDFKSEITITREKPNFVEISQSLETVFTAIKKEAENKQNQAA